MTPPEPNKPQIPGRARPFAKTRIETPRWQRLWLGRELSPTQAEYDAVVAALWDGDPAMDALLESEPGVHALFRRAVEHGIDCVPEAPQALRDFFRIVETDPPWLDRRLLDAGVRFMQGIGLAGPYVLRDLALMGGYLLSGFNHVLVSTGALTKDASQRIAETGQWWVDCTEHGGLEQCGPGYRSTLHVRLVHALVRRSLSRDPDWDANQWGVPINQIDMTATYLGFCVVMLGGVRMLGIPVTPAESKAVMHLWAYAAWLMGVDERWLVHSERDGVVRLAHAVMTQSPPDWTSRELARALAREPLERTFEVLPKLQSRLAYHRHLSVSRYFLGKRKMQRLGLPEHVLPWFPVLTAVPRCVAYLSQRTVPALQPRQQRRGRAAQLAVLDQMFGASKHQVGVHRGG